MPPRDGQRADRRGVLRDLAIQLDDPASMPTGQEPGMERALGQPAANQDRGRTGEDRVFRQVPDVV